MDRLHGVEELPVKSLKICIYMYFSGERPAGSIKLSKKSGVPKESGIPASDASSIKNVSLTVLHGLGRAFGVFWGREMNTIKLRF